MRDANKHVVALRPMDLSGLLFEGGGDRARQRREARIPVVVANTGSGPCDAVVAAMRRADKDVVGPWSVTFVDRAERAASV